jgi:polar amino acid transport system permease protein
MKLENRFRLQVGLVMLCLLGGFAWFVNAFELDYRFALSKLPLLAGLELSPEGFIQGIPLTLLLCLLSTVLAVVIGMLSALGRCPATRCCTAWPPFTTPSSRARRSWCRFC